MCLPARCSANKERPERTNTTTLEKSKCWPGTQRNMHAWSRGAGVNTPRHPAKESFQRRALERAARCQASCLSSQQNKHPQCRESHTTYAALRAVIRCRLVVCRIQRAGGRDDGAKRSKMTGLADKAGQGILRGSSSKRAATKRRADQGQLAASMVPWHAKSTGIKELPDVLSPRRPAGAKQSNAFSSQWPIAWFLFVSVPVIYSLFFRQMHHIWVQYYR